MDDKQKNTGQRMNRKKARQFIFILAFAVFLTLWFSNYSLGTSTPEGPQTLQVVNSTSKNAESSKTISAVAGNVTQLNIFARTQTRTWQGYYGNVSGTITLQDSNDNTIYDWENANPSGQIFASPGPIDFSDGNIECYNFTKQESGYRDLASMESYFGIPEKAVDGINETFNMTTDFDPFYITTTYIDDLCPVVYLYNSTNHSTKDTYQELLLYDKTSTNAVFTSIIEPGGIDGFDGRQWDFEMIVADNGRNGDIDATTYYFYVSLE